MSRIRCVSGLLAIAILALHVVATGRAQAAVTAVPAWAQVRKSVVVVGYRKSDGTFVSYGTGFCVQSNAKASEFVTDDHIVVAPPLSKGPASLVVALPGGSAVAATIVKESPTTDLALVSAPVGNVPVLQMSTALPALGASISVAAFPYSGTMTLPSAPTLLAGSVTAFAGSWLEFTATSGAVAQGSGGAPLFDPQTGAVYGVVEGHLTGAQSAQTNVAIPASVLRAFLGTSAP